MGGIFDSPEMLAAFYEETEEQLQQLEQGILDLEHNGETQETIQNIFRAAHTLKGASSAVGFENMKILTHEMENVLDKIRNSQLKVTKNTINVLFKCLDLLKLLKEEFIIDRKNVTTDISSILNQLKKILEDKESETNEGNKSIGAIENNKRLVDFEIDFDQMAQIEQAIIAGQNCYVCEVKLAKESVMKSVRAHLILNYFNELGFVIKTIPNFMESQIDEDIDNILYLILTQLDAKTLEENAKKELMDVENVNIYEYEVVSSFKGIEENKTINNNLSNKINKNSENSEKKISQTVRVNVDKLEKMMNLVGELLIEHTRINQIGNTLHNKYISDNLTDDFLGISNHVSRIISELQEVVMKTRMLPIHQLFNRFPRMVRDLAESLNKDIELILDGGETEMDKSIIEEMSEPLIHIIRNSIDHGIETPEERIKVGKSPTGNLRISAYHQENNVVLTVEDDGRGIDLNKIKESAIKKRIISAQDAELMSEGEIINLIFHSGLSTAEKITDVSGRGVGMDVVRNCIDKLNGIIDVYSKAGEGTKFTIKLPLTLAILTGLLVKINDEEYALPMSNVVEIVRKTEEDIEFVKGQAVVTIREKLIPLVWLQDYFNIPKHRKKKKIFVVLLGVAEKRFGLVVDELIGNQEIVVKPLGTYVGKIEGYSGATILGDGNVACILDVAGIMKMIGTKKISLREKEIYFENGGK